MRAFGLFALLLMNYRVGCECGAIQNHPAGEDAGVDAVDADPVDAGPVDAGPVDAGPLDAGPLDAGPLDAGPLDAGSDGGIDAGPTCGNGICAGAETCTNCAIDCGICTDGTCNGSGQVHLGCRGSGCTVCTEDLVGYPRYLANHPACTENPTCGGSLFQCSPLCPPPSSADM